MNKNEIDNLLTLMQKGDEHAFSRLYEGMRKGVFSYAYIVTGQRALSEDVMQEVFIKIRRYITSYKSGTNAQAWILQLTKTTALNEIKKQREMSLDEGLGGDGRRDVYDGQAGYILDAIRDKLDKNESQIVYLKLIAGFKHREIAELTKKPLGTVLSLYNKGIKKLQIYLREER